MKKIAVVTSTRADYSLLYPVIKELRKYESKEYKICLIVTGTHLHKEYGYTIIHIQKSGMRIDSIVETSVKSETALDITENEIEVLRNFSVLFSKEKYNAILILGDRYEMLMIAVAAMNMQIPIIHLYGGDTTEGVIDECIRHSITKMSFLHFPTNEISRKRIIQMGENPLRVFNFGAPGLDNILNMQKNSKQESLKMIGLHECKYALCAYHPVTLEDYDVEKQIRDFLDALSLFPTYEFIITKSNADQKGALINRILDQEAKERVNIHIYSSLDAKVYLSLMKYAEALIGNSSSGILEAPAFHIPTVNIGDRQKGRLQLASIINCMPDRDSIVDAMTIAFSDQMKEICRNVKNPYGDGNASVKIAAKIIEVINGSMDLKKHFHDL